MLSRRSFFKLTAAGVLALYVSSKGGTAPRLLAQIPGGTLNPASIPKYAIPLLIPPAMPKVGTIKKKSGQEIDYYEIAMRQFHQQILPPGLPMTTVWGYGSHTGTKKDLLIFNTPSLTIEATHNTPVRIKWINDLKDADGNYLPHLLPVDPTLTWANPPGGILGRDTQPFFTSMPGRYTGPIPMVPHVHGAADVGDESDGYAEAWYLPAASDIPAGYATVGAWYDFFNSKAAGEGYLAPGTTAWEPGTAVCQYPNSQRASTMWYHDHALGLTRLNVYAGPAGFFILRGGPDDEVRDTRTGKKAVLPGPAPQAGDKFLPKNPYYEIPLAIQDRAFSTDGSLFYPNFRAFFDGITSYIPDTDISPIWNPEFFGNCILVNGNTWPYLRVEQRRYRFRFLNGCDSRFLILDFSQVPGVEVWQIGNDGGFLAAPVNMTAVNGNRLLMSSAERADVIVDFTNVAVGNYVLGNVGPDGPFAGLPLDPDQVADPNSTGKVMQFQVGPALTADKTTPSQFLQLPAIPRIGTATVTRPFALLEEMSEFFADAPVELRLGTVTGDPAQGMSHWTSRKWDDPVTENPAVGATEVWEFYNVTIDAQPIHIHALLFEVVNRQAISVVNVDQTVQVAPGSTPQPPEPWETGYKDTVTLYPYQVTRVRARFNTPGQYAWHCHILEHEDNAMMRPYRVGPPQPGQPGEASMGDTAMQPASAPAYEEEAFIGADEETTHVYMPFVANQ